MVDIIEIDVKITNKPIIASRFLVDAGTKAIPALVAHHTYHPEMGHEFSTSPLTSSVFSTLPYSSS
ncbi:MAG: hypothetical protein SGJ27_20210 [Candidatus Melainabacteria bacterium]|nr:hypothetical protein [Candidatus Melainabacteria bacterium]